MNLSIIALLKNFIKGDLAMGQDLHRQIIQNNNLRGVKQSVIYFASMLDINLSDKKADKIVETLKSWKINSTSPNRLLRPDFLKKHNLTSAEKKIINEMLDTGGFLILASI